MTDFTPIDPGELSRYLDEYAVELMKKYYSSPEYSGGWFERFGGGGDHPETAGQFTSDDIVAVSMVGTRIPGQAAIQILEYRAEELNALLAQIPVDVDLWEAPEEAIGPDSPAGRLWGHLAELPGMSRAAAGNLLARKRPRLIPVYNRVIRNSLGRKDDEDWWRALRAVLTSRPGLLTAMEPLRREAELEGISLLRVLYVCIWSRAYGRPESAPDAES